MFFIIHVQFFIEQTASRIHDQPLLLVSWGQPSMPESALGGKGTQRVKSR